MEYGILGLIVLVLDILAIVNILGGSGSAAEKLVWTVVILLLPVIGLVLWWFMGRKTTIA